MGGHGHLHQGLSSRVDFHRKVKYPCGTELVNEFVCITAINSYCVAYHLTVQLNIPFHCQCSKKGIVRSVDSNSVEEFETLYTILLLGKTSINFLMLLRFKCAACEISENEWRTMSRLIV